MNRLILISLLAMSLSAKGIVIRHDVDDSKYRVATTEFPALVDLPGEGHGVLIAPQWVVTAAHAVTWQSEIKQVVLNGKVRGVEKVIVHSGYKRPPQALIDQAVKTGDATQLIDFLSSNDDIALIKLADPVSDVTPVKMFSGNDELGETVELIGKGATGTGLAGQDMHASHRGDLRRAYNRIVDVKDRWICYVFDKPPSGLELEGISGDGDSGGPVLIKVKGEWQLAGLASWKKHVQDNALILHAGFYGQKNYNVRVSHYRGWINDQIRAASDGTEPKRAERSRRNLAFDLSPGAYEAAKCSALTSLIFSPDSSHSRSPLPRYDCRACPR